MPLRAALATQPQPDLELAKLVLDASERWENYGWDSRMDDAVALARSAVAGSATPTQE
jgi:hypothetical protein